MFNAVRDLFQSIFQCSDAVAELPLVLLDPEILILKLGHDGGKARHWLAPLLLWLWF